MNKKTILVILFSIIFSSLSACSFKIKRYSYTDFQNLSKQEQGEKCKEWFEVSTGSSVRTVYSGNHQYNSAAQAGANYGYEIQKENREIAKENWKNYCDSK